MWPLTACEQQQTSRITTTTPTSSFQTVAHDAALAAVLLDLLLQGVALPGGAVHDLGALGSEGGVVAARGPVGLVHVLQDGLELVGEPGN